MRIIYFDCFAGISGDMTVSALIDLGVPLEIIREGLAALPLPLSSYQISTGITARKGIRAASFDVRVEEHQPHRHYRAIAGMIETSALVERSKEMAQRIFYRLAEAEAKVHGVEIDQVHFHEVGAVDSIVDIVATAIALDYLEVQEIHVSPLPLGSGFVETAHGRLPVPAPATAELLRGLPVHGNIGPGERVTPTGAAIVAALGTCFGPAPDMIVSGIGYGAGNKDFDDIPNVLRIVSGEKPATLSTDQVSVIETHIDDMNPEILGFVMERLLADGALDVTFSPLQMKKNRPGTKITVIAPPDRLHALARLILTETTAIGVRHHTAERLKLDRVSEERETSLGRMTVKVMREGGNIVRISPEFEECRKVAEKLRMPLMDVYRRVAREIVQE